MAIVGHNGASKSTLRTVSAFSRVHEGRLNVLGIDVTLLRESRDARSSGELRHLRSQVAQVLQGLHLVRPPERARQCAGRRRGADDVVAHLLRRWPAAYECEQARAAPFRVGMAWAAARRTDSLGRRTRQRWQLPARCIRMRQCCWPTTDCQSRMLRRRTGDCC